MADISTLVVKVDTTDINRAVTSLGSFTKKAKTTQIDSGALAKKIGGVATGFAAMGAASITATTAIIASAASQAREIDNLARLAGVGVEEFQNLAYATNQVGISGEQLADISKDVKDKLGDFIATGGGPFIDFFENVAPKIGLTAEALQGLSGPDVLVAVKKAMDDVNISAEEQVFYLESIGNDATLLIPLLENTGEALYGQADAASQLGLAMSEIESDRLLEADIAVKQLTGVFGALRDSVAADLSPVLVDFTNMLMSKMVESGTSVDDVAQKIAIGFLEAFDKAVTALEFFHINWLRLESAIPVLVNTFVQAGSTIATVFLDSFLAPLDSIFTGLEKVSGYMGKEFINPLDIAREKIETLGATTQGVMEQSFEKILQAEQGYTDLHETVDDYIDIVVDSGKETEKTATKTTKALTEQNDKRVADDKKTAKESLKIAEDKQDDILSLNETLTEKVKKLTLSEVDYKKWALEEEVKDLEILADGNKANLELIETYYTKSLEEISDNVEDSTDEWVDLFGYFAGEVKSTMQNDVRDAFVEQFGGIGGAWGALWDGMLAKMASVLVDMSLKWAESAVNTMFDTDFDYFHSGSMGIKDDEGFAVLQEGEMVIPQGAANQIRDNLGLSTGSGGSGGDFSALVGATAGDGVIDTGTWGPSFANEMGNYYSSDVKKALALAISTGDFSGSLTKLLNPMTAMGNVIGAGTSTLKDELGLNGIYSDIGGGFGSILSSMAISGTIGGPMGMMIGAMSSLAGSYLGDLLGDMFDDREHESWRDALESGDMTQYEYDSRVTGANLLNGTISGDSLLGGAFEGLGNFFTDTFNMIADPFKDIYGDIEESITGFSFTSPSNDWNTFQQHSITKPEETPASDFLSGLSMGYGFLGTSTPVAGLYEPDPTWFDEAIIAARKRNNSFSQMQRDFLGADTYQSFVDRGQIGGDNGGGYDSGGYSGGTGSAGTGGGSAGYGPGLASGGIVSNLMVPQGDDGFAALKFGEGVLDTDTMGVLKRNIRTGSMGANDAMLASILDAVKTSGYAIAKNTQGTYKVLRKFDTIGMPGVRA